MIGYISGKFLSKKPNKVLVDVNGVGYLVNISLNTFEKLEGKTEAAFFTYLNVREDALDLYGFTTTAEKEMFELLISVNGIGPKVALSVLSGIQLPDLREAISSGNIARIISTPGIGRKTAERMIIELRDKINALSHSIELGEESVTQLKTYTVRNDAVTALVNLGYNQKIAERAVRACLDKNPEAKIEDLIKDSLAALNS